MWLFLGGCLGGKEKERVCMYAFERWHGEGNFVDFE